MPLVPQKALIGLIVADAVVLVAFTLLFVFHVMPPMQLVYLLIPVTVIVDGAFLVLLVRSRRSARMRPGEDPSEMRPR